MSEDEGGWELRAEDEALEEEMLGGQGTVEEGGGAREVQARGLRREDEAGRRATAGPEWGWPPFGDPG